MLNLNLYAFFAACGTFIIFYTSYLTLRRAKAPPTRILLFLGLSGLAVYFFGKFLGSIGFWIMQGDFYWGPSTVLGFLLLEVVFWRPWALREGKTGQLLLKRWSLASPLGQAVGRAGCYFTGCCYIRSGWPLNWPLLEASYLALLALLLSLKREEIAPAKLYQAYLYGALGGRFFLDFLRGDHIRGTHVFGLKIFSFPQLVCVILILWLFLDSHRRKGHNRGHEIRSRKSGRP